MLKVTANQNKTIYVRFAVFPHLLESFYHSKFRKNHVLNNFTFFFRIHTIFGILIYSQHTDYHY